MLQRNAQSIIKNQIGFKNELPYFKLTNVLALNQSSVNTSTTIFLPALAQDSNSVTYEVPIDCAGRLLAWQSCHILLILSNHCTNSDTGGSGSLYNPYRMALFHFTDSLDTPSNMASGIVKAIFKLSIGPIF